MRVQAREAVRDHGRRRLRHEALAPARRHHDPPERESPLLFVVRVIVDRAHEPARMSLDRPHAMPAWVGFSGQADALSRLRHVPRWREVPVPHGNGIAVRLVEAFGVVRGDGPQRQVRRLEHGQRHVSGKADVAVGIELRDVDVPVGQRVEPYGAEERLLRLDQQDRLREALNRRSRGGSARAT